MDLDPDRVEDIDMIPSHGEDDEMMVEEEHDGDVVLEGGETRIDPDGDIEFDEGGEEGEGEGDEEGDMEAEPTPPITGRGGFTFGDSSAETGIVEAVMEDHEGGVDVVASFMGTPVGGLGQLERVGEVETSFVAGGDVNEMAPSTTRPIEVVQNDAIAFPTSTSTLPVAAASPGKEAHPEEEEEEDEEHAEHAEHAEAEDDYEITEENEGGEAFEGHDAEDGDEHEEGLGGEHGEEHGEYAEEEGYEHDADEEYAAADETGEEAGGLVFDSGGDHPAEAEAASVTTEAGEATAEEAVEDDHDEAAGEEALENAETSDAHVAETASHPEDADEVYFDIEQDEYDEEDLEMEYPTDIHSLPQIILHFPDRSNGKDSRILFAASPENTDLRVLLDGRVAALGEASLSDVWRAIKLELKGDEVLQKGEMVITEKQMELKMGEDDVQLQSVTLLELAQVYCGCGLPSPMELYVTYEPHRFITRFNAIQQEVRAQLQEMSQDVDAEADSAIAVGLEDEMGHEEETYADDQGEDEGDVEGDADADEGAEAGENGEEESHAESDDKREEGTNQKRTLQGVARAEHGSRLARPAPEGSVHPNADWANSRPSIAVQILGTTAILPRRFQDHTEDSVPSPATAEVIDVPPPSRFDFSRAIYQRPSYRRNADEDEEGDADDDDEVEGDQEERMDVVEADGNARSDEDKDTIDTTESDVTETFPQRTSQEDTAVLPEDEAATTVNERHFVDEAVEVEVRLHAIKADRVPLDEIALKERHEALVTPSATPTASVPDTEPHTAGLTSTAPIDDAGTTTIAQEERAEVYASTADSDDGIEAITSRAEKQSAINDDHLGVSPVATTATLDEENEVDDDDTPLAVTSEDTIGTSLDNVDSGSILSPRKRSFYEEDSVHGSSVASKRTRGEVDDTT